MTINEHKIGMFMLSGNYTRFGKRIEMRYRI